MEPDNSAGARVTIPVGVGTMGWSYDDWNGVFYPDGADARDRLRYYARAFDTVEIDSTFYGAPRESTLQSWLNATPDHFVFCPKVPRLITHDLGLRDAMEPLAEFVRVMSVMGARRGPMLLQMPPSFTYHDIEALQTLLASIHEIDDPDARFAIEFRDSSLLTTGVFELLRRHNVALVASDYTGMPRRFAPTADFAYVRLIGRHGSFERHREVIEDHSAIVRRWAAALVKHQSRFRDAWVFCNNDYEGFSPATCWSMQEALGLPTRRPPADTQRSLF